MSTSVANSPQRYYVNNTAYEIPPNSGRSSVYGKTRRNGNLNQSYSPVNENSNQDNGR